MKKKRIVSLLMAFIMMFSYMIPIVAAPVEMNPTADYIGIEPTNLNPPYSNQRLIGAMNFGFSFGSESPTPVRTTTPAADQAFMQFNTNLYPMMGSWQLRYEISEFETVIIDIVRTPSEANPNGVLDITYRIENSPLTDAQLISTFMVHSTSAIQTGLVPIRSYLNQGLAPGRQVPNPAYDGTATNPQLIVEGNPNQVVMNHTGLVDALDDDILENVLYPQFRIGAGQGFSFTYGTQTVHMRWDGATNLFEIATGSLNPGLIYTATLQHTASPGGVGDAPAPTVQTVGPIAMNIGVTNIEVVPFANNDRFATLQDAIRRVAPWGGAVDAFLWPAEEDQDTGLILYFDVPTDVNGGPLTAAGLGLNALPAVITLNSVSPTNHSVQIIIDDVLAAAPTVQGNPFIMDGGVMHPLDVDVDVTPTGQIRVEIGGMLRGVIYDHTSTIGLHTAQSETVFARPSYLEMAQAFTFPHFRIEYVNNVPFAVIEAFGMEGEYVLREEVVIHGNMNNPTPRPYILQEFVSAAWAEQGQELIMLPLSAIANTGQYRKIQIAFRPFDRFSSTTWQTVTQEGVYSQILVYQPIPPEGEVRTPLFFNILEYRHIPQDLTRQSGIVEMLLAWDMGERTVIDTLFEEHNTGGQFWIDYDLQWTISPENYDEFPDNVLLTLRTHITRDAENNKHVRFELINAPPGVYLPEEMTESRQLEVWDFEGTQRYRPTMWLEVDTRRDPLRDPEFIPEPVPPHFYFFFPHIYFMNIRPTHRADVNGTHNLGTVGGSNYDTFTLSDFDHLEVPPPQNFRVIPGSETTLSTALGDPVDRVSFDVEWTIPGQQIMNYLLYSYGLQDPNPRLSMTLFISENEPSMVNLIEDHSIELSHRGLDAANPAFQGGLPSTDGARAMVFGRHGTPRVVAEAEPPDQDHFGSIPVQTFDFLEMQANGASLREALRRGYTVAIQGITLTPAQWLQVQNGESITVAFTLDGLDKNQQYFMLADIIIEQRGVDFKDDPVFVREASRFSNLIGATTQGDREVPDGTDQVPPAPDPINVDDITFNSARTWWNRIPAILDLPEGYTEHLEYEVIRIRGDQMDREHMTNRVTFGQVWSNLSEEHDADDKVGLRTEESLTEQAMLRMWGGNWNTAAPENRFAFDATLENINITSLDLESNEIYFYYVRTVRIIRIHNADGTVTELPHIYSVWNHVNVTTAIVDAPFNLRVESWTRLQPETEIDRMTQVIVSFEAHILYETLGNMINNNLFVEFQLRMDDGEWIEPPVRESADFLRKMMTRSPNDPDDSWFLYLISGLEPGAYYSLRVRFVDRDGNISMWSNIAYFITDRDPHADDVDNLVRDWLDYLRDRLEEMVRNPQWTMRQDPNAFHTLFRSSVFNETLRQSTGGHIALPLENSWQTTYFFPIEAFQMAWDNEMTFHLINPNGNIEVIIPARAIDLEHNLVVAEANRGKRYGVFEDYMVRLEINWGTAQNINGGPALTPTADIRAGLQPVSEDMRMWELELIEILGELIEDIITDREIVDFITDAVRQGTPGEYISRYVIQAIEHGRQKFIQEKNFYFRDIHYRAALPIVAFDAGIMIRTLSLQDAAAITAHQYQGNRWSALLTHLMGTGHGINTTVAGTFVFTGRIVVVAGIENVEGGPAARAVMARHGLDDFFGRNAIDTASNATRNQLINSAARIMGAPREVDPQAWLRANNVQIPVGAGTAPISTQEGLHFIMLVYQAQTNTRIETIRISNPGLVSTLNLHPNFRTSVAAAMELNFVTNIQPNAPLTVGQLLEILAKLDSLVSL